MGVELLEDETAKALPTVLPVGWRRVRQSLFAYRWPDSERGLSVVLSVERCDDKKRWLHVSVASPTRMPSYRELCDVKRIFMGPQSKAIEVFAPESEHVNIHPNCRHLWSCLDGDVLPDFRREGGL
jgi:hypothetical protein